MPEISRFFGIVIQMYYKDHDPPHFHVRYSGQRALVAIEDSAVLRGQLSPRALALVREWAALHRAELLRDWELARAEAELRPIAPLEQHMLKNVVAAKPLEGYRLHLQFEDGSEGVVDLASHLSFGAYSNRFRTSPTFGKSVSIRTWAQWCGRMVRI